MKKFIIATTLLASLGTYAQSDEQESIEIQKSYSARVGVQAIVRNVVKKRLLGNADKKILTLGLETGQVELGQMICDRATGKDNCSIDVSIGEIEDKRIKFASKKLKLNIVIIQGNIFSAYLVADQE